MESKITVEQLLQELNVLANSRGRRVSTKELREILAKASQIAEPAGVTLICPSCGMDFAKPDWELCGKEMEQFLAWIKLGKPPVNDMAGVVKEFERFCNNYIEAAETEWGKTDNQVDLAAATVAKIMLNKFNEILSRHTAKDGDGI